MTNHSVLKAVEGASSEREGIDRGEGEWLTDLLNYMFSTQLALVQHARRMLRGIIHSRYIARTFLDRIEEDSSCLSFKI